MPIFSYLQAEPAAFISCFAILGLVVGSFLNVVIHRLPRILENDWRRQCRELLELADGPDEPLFNLIRPGSRCPHCAHPIRWYENIPVLSYLVLRGRCSACAHTISLRYPLIEIAAGTLAALCAWYFGYSWAALFATVLSWGLLTLSLIDFDTKYLPDDIILPLLWLGLAVNLAGLFAPLPSAVLGAIGGYGILWVVFQAFRLLTGKEGMGYGDFKLLAMLGAWLGWEMLPLIIVLASFSGAVVGIGMVLLSGHDRREPIPFGPYLAAAGWVALLWGTDLVKAYLNWTMTV